jgi:hypothetical protein
MNTKIFTNILLLPLLAVFIALYSSSITYAQENAIFNVSPGTITLSDVPLGTLITLTQKLVVQNGDTNARTVNITSGIPFQGSTTVGYQPIPNANWVIPYPSQINVNTNSYAIVQIVLSIPRWENLTKQKWEVWVSATREPLAGETAVLKDTVRIEIETAAALPLTKSTTFLTISEENFTLRAGEYRYLTATLTSNGNPIEGEDLTWSATAGNIVPSSGQTNAVGQVTAVYTAPSYKTSVTVSASYAGSGQYIPSSFSSNGTITAPAPLIPTGFVIGIAVVVSCIIGAALLHARKR